MVKTIAKRSATVKYKLNGKTHELQWTLPYPKNFRAQPGGGLSRACPRQLSVVDFVPADGPVFGLDQLMNTPVRRLCGSSNCGSGVRMNAVACSRRNRRRLPCDRSHGFSGTRILAERRIPQRRVLRFAGQGREMERKST